MAWKPKKKPKVLSREEQANIKEKLNIYKKFFKPLKGEIIFKRKESSQEWVQTARYFSEDDMKKDAIEIVNILNSIRSKKTWEIVSERIVGKEVESNEDDNNKQEMTKDV